jgi:hypothetical protein
LTEVLTLSRGPAAKKRQRSNRHHEKAVSLDDKGKDLKLSKNAMTVLQSAAEVRWLQNK